MNYNEDDLNYSEFIFLKHCQKNDLQFDNENEIAKELNEFDNDYEADRDRLFDFVEVDHEKILNIIQNKTIKRRR